MVSELVTTCALSGCAHSANGIWGTTSGAGLVLSSQWDVALSHRQSSGTHFTLHTHGIFSHSQMASSALHVATRPRRLACFTAIYVVLGGGGKKTQFFSCVYSEGRDDKENKTGDGWSSLFHPFQSFFSLTLPCLLHVPHKENIPVLKKLYPLSKQAHKPIIFRWSN